MGKNRNKGTATTKGRSADNNNNNDAMATVGSDGMLYVDPARVRFQHSRIRPFFSGCGRSVEGTLEEIRTGTTQLSDLPPIQVLVGPSDENGEPWYFSLNNRRLWVLKRLRDEGFLEPFGNKIHVRVRTHKSEQERERYSVENCALEAKLVREKPHKRKGSTKMTNCSEVRNGQPETSNEIILDRNENNDESGDDATNGEKEVIDNVAVKRSHGRKGFGVLMMEDDSDNDESSSDESDDDDDGPPPANRFGALQMD
ncbi:hypothetical protein IV203_010611 [Nitzschia inconspicua]|uniref:Uncharacterized protein n=1 Tax=Nitzschia inconspicua TaxID=303405 RepID=A0A9K3PLL0_9STRA|nr:hypothetical protein IV203_010611 [Nitzschia inconspicua]